ncbi:vWA domain-containing protein [Methylocystis parvus]|uniref:VWA domain-containing protein n=1 Tax=Methylocystis parvus TaxID=134 RepID=A0A6B8LZ35_9HYPH|nr:vWA domain-containing protein [Methylocystis parvus]QGM96724.1 VWA domain-containing protein [Methylocystis parvus]WBJ99409.1 VWA domain-containing protein [Methylocystis parvus OBBP]
MRCDLRDPRLILLTLTAALLLATFVAPQIDVRRPGFDLLAVVDITGSMNVRDYAAGGKPISRLEKVKAVLRQLIARLPCPSRVALGVFTERRPFLLFEPIDACADFSPLEAAIAAIDWRMAWEGDSRISAGLFRAVDMARELKTDLLFFTDGQEAPPLPASGGPVFEAKPGETRGLIVGTGGYDLSPIPKFDDKGRETGFVAIDDVPHESRFGLPPKGAERREGFNARNAPFGATAVVGVEHLSSVKEDYLRTLSEKTGLGYFHLDDKASLLDAYRAAGTERPRAGKLDMRPYLGGLSAACLFAAFSVAPLLERLARNRQTTRFARK